MIGSQIMKSSSKAATPRKTKRKKAVKSRSRDRDSVTGRLTQRVARQDPGGGISESAHRLKSLRKEAGLSVRAMAKALDMGATSYQHYEDRYKKRYLPFEMIERAGRILLSNGVPRESIDQLSPNPSNVSDEFLNIIYAPLISWAQAGGLSDVVNTETVGEFDSEIAVEYKRKTVLALRIVGPSINRVAPDGAIVVIDYSQRNLKPSHFYLVRKDGAATVKRYQNNPDRFEPFSTEPDHPIVFPSKELHIVGRAIRVVTDL